MHTRARLSAAQDGSLPLHVAAANQASEAVVVELLKAHAGAAAEKDEVCPPRSHLCALRSIACVHTRTHLLASALRRRGGCPCMLPCSTRRRRRWFEGCWRMARTRPRKVICDHV